MSADTPKIPQRHNFDAHIESILPHVADRDPNELLEPEYVASLLHVSLQWLAQARSKGYSPPYIKLSPSLVRYPCGLFVKFLLSRTKVPEFGKERPIWNKGIPGRPGWPPKPKPPQQPKA